MLTAEEEFSKLGALIDKFDNDFRNKTLTSVKIEQAQELLDIYAKKFQYDESLGTSRFLLYEFQALIEVSKASFTRARTFIEEAQKQMGEFYEFRSHTIKELLATYQIHTLGPLKNTNTLLAEKPIGQFNGKLEGWLAFYGLRVIFLPLVFLVDIAAIVSFDANLLDQTIGDFLGIVFILDAVGLVTTIVSWYYFFNKRRKAIDLFKYFETSFGVTQIVLGFWLSSLYTSHGVTDDDTNIRLIFYGIYAIIWAIYWAKSRRVRATFVS